MHRLAFIWHQPKKIINGVHQIGRIGRCMSSTTTLKDQERAGLTYASTPSNRTRIRDFAAQYDSVVAAGERRSEITPALLSGRIVTPLRELSSNLLFFHIESEGARIQVLADRKHYGSADEFHNVHHRLRRGDIVSIEGFPGKTKKGEFSIVSKNTSLLAPCVRDLPMGRGDGKDAISDVGFLHKHREVGLLVGGSEARQVFQQRANVIKAIRSFLDARSFLEVETPVLWPNSGGAFAKPFQTTTRNLTLRIAPELSLKRLVIGGYDKVYELGKVFRDEGTSPKHNPEFTSIELYEAYANARDLETFTRDLLQTCFDAVHPNQNKRISPMFDIDFDAAYPRVSIADQLEALGGFQFDDPLSIVPKNILPLLNSKSRASLTPNDEKSIPRLLDKLVGQEVESKLDPKIPTFLVDHPVALSPLAKERPDRKGVVERFELFAGTFELCNAYSELNDPKTQRQRFADQLKYRLGGDEECQLPDEGFCEALEYGLPPTAGWGMGVDRLVMVLLGKHSIKDVILFPHMSSL